MPPPFSPPSVEPEADRHPFRPRQGLGLKSQPPRHRFCSRPVNRTRSLSTKPSQRKFLKNSGNRRRIAMESKENNSISAMDEVQEILGNNSLEDVTWLCSLSESELDMLIGLKMLVVQRARTLGCEELSRKFDLKMLRSLGLILMEYLKEKVKDKSRIPDLAKLVPLIDCSNLLKSSVENILSEEEIKECIGANSRKRRANRLKSDAARKQRR